MRQQVLAKRPACVAIVPEHLHPDEEPERPSFSQKRHRPMDEQLGERALAGRQLEGRGPEAGERRLASGFLPGRIAHDYVEAAEGQVQRVRAGQHLEVASPPRVARLGAHPIRQHLPFLARWRESVRDDESPEAALVTHAAVEEVGQRTARGDVGRFLLIQQRQV